MPPFRRLLRWALLAFAALSVLGLLAAGTVYFVVASKLPDVEALRTVELQEPMYVHARDGKLIALFGETRRYPVDIKEVPEAIKQAFIAIEDNRFYEHHGVDYKGVARAIWLLATTDDERVPGGSTITQQVARQFFLSSEYSYTRKLAEMMLALKMERELDKDEIFQLYLNKTFFGHRSYGIAAAAEFYYGKALDELDLDEIATLASIPKFPSSGNPVTNPDRARIRRDYVLQRMRELGFITRAQETASQAVPMHAEPHEVPTEVEAPYVAEMVRREMIDRFGEDALTRGYRVTTTIDARLQDAAQKAVRDGLLDYDHRHGWRKPERLDLAPGEDAATAAKRLAGIPVQGRLVPAIVLGTGKGTAEVVIADGSTLVLDAESSRWTGRSPSALLARGDLVRVRRVEPAPAKDGEAPRQEAPRFQLAQVPLAQSALVSLDPDDGALRALVGGFSFAANKFNRATQARRQPGSSFKPFLYAAAMERGFNPASIVLDAPVVFRDRAGNIWRPQNDTGDFRGPMRLRQALVQSRNLVSVRLLDAIGIDYARRYISHFGIDEDLLPPNLSMSLGTASLPPLTVARGYAVFPNGGFRITPYFIDEVRDRDGELVFKERPPTACPSCAVGNSAATTVQAANVVAGFNFGPQDAAPPGQSPRTGAETVPAPERPPADTVLAPRAIDARVAYQMISMMRDVVQHGTGIRAKVLGREDVAGKTGSTNEHRDAWFSGFADDIVTTVWVGRDDFKSLGRGEYGGRAALPIWIDYMRVALEGRPLAANEPPDGMVQVSVGAGGQLLPEGGGIVEWVKAEDLERMAADPMTGYGDAARSQEEAFDIF
ncbi:penicillin-binding protein 1A [Cognatiluteimonas lumbrici]|uniref:penicillin-binding protein 1A n=1 Tax=Cognatiluteimonas lumbrici TaxID=2559601 RepID=UPI00112899B8|nr:penicillin-binding protein 1A [Luteimonas lumbrici]